MVCWLVGLVGWLVGSLVCWFVHSSCGLIACVSCLSGSEVAGVVVVVLGSG